MRRTTEEMIKDSIAAGYELLAEGTGNCDAYLEEYRGKGYDVRSWYLNRTREGKTWVMYGRKRIRTAKKKVNVDYSIMTVKELRKICSEKKIPKYSKMSKEEIVRVLSEAC